jgi:hypothetical protein
VEVSLDKLNKGESQMKSQLSLLGTKINRQHLQLILTIVALAMLILGVGAPMDGGGGGC